MTVALLLPLITGLSALVRWVAVYFGDSATLHRLELAQERQRAKTQVERERLLATYARIAREPVKSDEELLRSLREKFTRPDDAPKP
jgi:hypothetical protein